MISPAQNITSALITHEPINRSPYSYVDLYAEGELSFSHRIQPFTSPFRRLQGIRGMRIGNGSDRGF